ncbi:MAG: McrC family protein [Desulfosalsimonadaceae bacterium]
MKPIVIPEYGRIERLPHNARPLERLQAFDVNFARQNNGCQVFDWSRRDFVRANSYVGVIMVPGLTVEILPKIDIPDKETTWGIAPYASRIRARDNLLYMLSLTRNVPVEERDLANLRFQKMPLLEVVIRIYIERLLAELRRGLDHDYIRCEENLTCLKGKILLNSHIRQNAAHRERAFVGYDDFIADTWLNRIIKWTCLKLLALTSHAGNQKRLREAIVLLDEIRYCEIEENDFAKVHLTRNNERYRIILDFGRMVLLRQSPAVGIGGEQTFSLLFPMEKLFEEFIASFLYRHAAHFEFKRSMIHQQSKNRRLHLLRCKIENRNKGRFQLKPDIIIDDIKEGARLILDTKWKFLKTDVEDRKNGVQQIDMYQLYAYATRYRTIDNILLFPRVPGVTEKSYCLEEDEAVRLRVAMINMNFDLLTAQGQAEFKKDIYRILHLS